MRYGRLGVAREGVLEGRFVMLLVGFWCSKIGDFGGEVGGVAGGVKIPYFTVGRGRREGFVGDFGREAISVHDTGFFGVVADVAGGEGDVAVVIVAEGVGEGEVATATIEGGEGGFSSLVGFAGLACFVRICSCSLVLLSNFSGHRLQANASVFSFAIRAFSACCCCSRYASLAAFFFALA